jgi:hypothetical protein
MITVLVWLLLFVLIVVLAHYLLAQTGLDPNVKNIILIVLIIVMLVILLNRTGILL